MCDKFTHNSSGFTRNVTEQEEEDQLGWCEKSSIIEFNIEEKLWVNLNTFVNNNYGWSLNMLEQSSIIVFIIKYELLIQLCLWLRSSHIIDQDSPQMWRRSRTSSVFNWIYFGYILASVLQVLLSIILHIYWWLKWKYIQAWLFEWMINLCCRVWPVMLEDVFTFL